MPAARVSARRSSVSAFGRHTRVVTIGHGHDCRGQLLVGVTAQPSVETMDALAAKARLTFGPGWVSAAADQGWIGAVNWGRNGVAPDGGRAARSRVVYALQGG